MVQMKIVCLGLDGLEYKFVLSWNLQNLQQKQFGKIEVPIHEQKKVPVSPEVWASFLTGKVIRGKDFARIGTSGKILELLMYLRKKVNLSLGVGKIFSKHAPRKFPKLNEPTFIDDPHIEEVNSPYYSYDHTVLSTIKKFGLNEMGLQQTINEMISVYEKRKVDILIEINKKLVNSRAVFAYMHFPDALQHLLFMRMDELKKNYNDLNLFISELKKNIDEDVIFIIVSDHGFDTTKGTHSNYGCYSSNVPLIPEPNHITDFFDIILNRTKI
jgi:hypothetical protein